MIPLFTINNYVIDTADLGNHLHGSIVDEFVEKFCEYVGVDYGCALNSATNAIFLALEDSKESLEIPSVLPPVVVNALLHGNNSVNFKDDIKWVGHSYTIYDKEYKIIDSAQRVDRNQFEEANDDDLMIFSFYPTKPVGGMDGGIVVSNNRDKISYFKERSLNGMSFAENNWERKQTSVGWKMYMNSAQAFVAMKNLEKLDEKKEKLAHLREFYNSQFELDNKSDHLYRINVENRKPVMNILRSEGITTGIHYSPLHLSPLYKAMCLHGELPLSEQEGDTTMSIPFNEKLTKEEATYVVEQIREHVNLKYF